MNGLLLKELLILKRGWKPYAFLIAFYTVFSFMDDPTFFSGMMALILLMLPMSSFSADELARWDGFAAALPGGRRAVVRAKYQFLFLAFGGAFVLSCLINLVISFAVREENGTFPELVVAALACTAVCLLIDCIFYPLLFRYGSQKSRILLAVVFAAVFAVFGMGAVIFSFNGGSPLDLLTGVSPFAAAAGAVVLIAAAVVISYRVSCRIYEKKEF
ncbi:MAG: ABC-2 transporter permease [Oscillospiraceae bacterium]